jgi:hypothetical protein
MSSSSSSSSSSKPNPSKALPPPGFALPAQKLRALVALYHQSQSFVTPEKLDEAIDRAFADVTNLRVFRPRRLDWPDLRLEVKERERLSRFGLPETLGSALSLYEAGCEEREGRVEQVFDAMYGTCQTDKPGLELLRDTWEDVEERLKGERDEE